MSANNPPHGQDPERTMAYGWNQGQQPGNPPPPYGQPYPPQQPYQQPSQQPYDLQAGWQQQGPEGIGPARPAGKGGKGWLVAVAAALAVVLLGGGAVWAVGAIGGGGTQPNEVLPASSIAYARLDLDPAANQKLALFQIARKFTVTKDSFQGEDPRKALFEALREDGGDDLAKLDFAKDVDPWLGNRLGVAVVPSGKEEPDVVVAVQVKDEAQARAGIAKLRGDGKVGLAFRDDYALLTSDQALADKYARASDSLADNAEFGDDMNALGEQGVLSFWGDLGAVAELAKKDMTPEEAVNLDQVKNARFAGALRFDSAYAELTGVVRGAEGLVDGDLEPVRLAELPATTAGALSISGLDQMINKTWAKYEQAISGSGGDGPKQVLHELVTSAGLQLPDDLATIVGKNLTIAVDGEGLDGDQIKGGVRVVTDPAKAQALVDKVQKAMAAEGQPVPDLAKASGDGVFTVATTEEYGKKLAEDGALGDSETFQTAVPNAGEATFGLFVDLDKVEKYYLQSMEGDEKANLQVLRAIGLSGRQTDTEASFSLRVLFN